MQPSSDSSHSSPLHASSLSTPTRHVQSGGVGVVGTRGRGLDFLSQGTEEVWQGRIVREGGYTKGELFPPHEGEDDDVSEISQGSLASELGTHVHAQPSDGRNGSFGVLERASVALHESAALLNLPTAIVRDAESATARLGYTFGGTAEKITTGKQMRYDRTGGVGGWSDGSGQGIFHSVSMPDVTKTPPRGGGSINRFGRGSNGEGFSSVGLAGSGVKHASMGWGERKLSWDGGKGGVMVVNDPVMAHSPARCVCVCVRMSVRSYMRACACM